jgi:hypothetical protein
MTQLKTGAVVQSIRWCWYFDYTTTALKCYWDSFADLVIENLKQFQRNRWPALPQAVTFAALSDFQLDDAPVLITLNI